MNSAQLEQIFVVEADSGNRGLHVVNWDELGPPNIALGRYDLGGGRKGGLPDFTSAPKLQVRLKSRRSPPYDVEEVGWQIWFVSDRFKEFAETIDPGAFDFVECDNSELVFKGEQITFWACGVRRFGNFLDEANCQNLVVTEERPGWRNLGYIYGPGRRIAIRRDALGNGHVFGLEEHRNSVFCDEHFMRAYKAQKFRPLTFTPV